ncbi:MAG TPA: histidine kinase dimerization/phospho-acceptor domain-containing protein, partial [Myxococcaceae bacterium]|nr:histidine kinase dimerization/phospho-acceptor domain-containing protein [Myxococcaceae bacterium]
MTSSPWVSQSRDEMLSALSHDVRSLLAAVRLQLELLEEKAGDLDPERTRAELRVTRLSAERAFETVDNLLQLSKLDADAVRPEAWDSVSLQAVCREVAAALRGMAEER